MLLQRHRCPQCATYGDDSGGMHCTGASGGCDEDYEVWRKRSTSAGDVAAAGHGTPTP